MFTGSTHYTHLTPPHPTPLHICHAFAAPPTPHALKTYHAASRRTAQHRMAQRTAPQRTALTITLPRTALHRTALHRTAPHRTALRRTAPHRTAPHTNTQELETQNITQHISAPHHISPAGHHDEGPPHPPLRSGATRRRRPPGMSCSHHRSPFHPPITTPPIHHTASHHTTPHTATPHHTLPCRTPPHTRETQKEYEVFARRETLSVRCGCFPDIPSLQVLLPSK